MRAAIVIFDWIVVGLFGSITLKMSGGEAVRTSTELLFCEDFMTQRKTCAGCPHLAKNKDSGLNFLVFYCGNSERGTVIPHRVEGKPDGWDCTFWRVPEFCELPDDEVLKSPKQAPKSEWVQMHESK